MILKVYSISRYIYSALFPLNVDSLASVRTKLMYWPGCHLKDSFYEGNFDIYCHCSRHIITYICCCVWQCAEVDHCKFVAILHLPIVGLQH